MSNADFGPIGDMEFGSLADLTAFAQAGREVSMHAGMIVIQAAHELQRACLYIPVTDGRPNAKAKRVSRPLRRAAMHMWAIQRCFAITPRVFVKTYEQEIGLAQGKGRKGIDLGRK